MIEATAASGMSNSDTASIIHKKARVGREDFDARAMSPSKALRLALAKSADTLYDMALTVQTVEQRRLNSNAVAARFGDDGLLILLDGADGKAGAIKLDTQFIAALIEVQIGGEVRPNPASVRDYTRTDAAMAAAFLDATLNEFDDQLASYDDAYLRQNLRFGDRIEDARLLGLALEGGKFDLFAVTADLGGGAKTGEILVLMPKALEAKSKERSGSVSNAQIGESLERSALDATATLDAVLAQIELPLKDVWALKPGMVLNLPADCLAETKLYAPQKHLVAGVRLGQMNGLRAVRVITDEQDVSGGEEMPITGLAAEFDMPNAVSDVLPIDGAALTEVQIETGEGDAALPITINAAEEIKA